MELAEDMFIYYVVTDQGVVRAVSLNVRPNPYALLPCTVASLLTMPIRDFNFFQMCVTQYVTNP